MKVIRYTVNGYGIFSQVYRLYENDNLYDIDEIDLDDIMDTFAKELPVPTCFKAHRDKFRCYFTEKGLQKFERMLKRLTAIQESYIGKVETEEREVKEDEVFYKDEYQVLLKIA